MERLHVFPDSEAFGRELAEASGLSSGPVGVHVFPDGESLVRVTPPAGEHAVLVRSLHHPRGKVFETLLAADALRRAGARRVTLVTPYLPYMRQDDVFRPGEAHSQSVFGRLVSAAFDAVVTVEAHLHRAHDMAHVFSCRAESLSAAPAIAEWLADGPKSTVLVGPDAESRGWLAPLAEQTDLPMVIGHKRRLGDSRVLLELPRLPAAERAVVVDDVASSGATLAQTAELLRGRGLPRVDAVVVHPVFAPEALERVRASGVQEIVSTDSVPHETNAIRLAPLVAAALRAGHAA